MQETSGHEQPKPRIPGPDWYLQMLIDGLTETRVRVPITLMVGGFLVSGELVTSDQYFDGLADEMKLPVPSEGEEPEDDFRWLAREIRKQRESPDGKQLTHRDIEFIHLQNARVFHTSGLPVPKTRPVSWRGRLSSVDGFWLGTLSQELVPTTTTV